MTDEDRVFKALADPTRRHLLDRLFERDGRTLTELESELEMTRFGVMKHLRVLEDAGLVVTRRSGREKLHFLNPVPIRLIHDRWIDKYTEHRIAALADLKGRTGGEQHDDHGRNDDAGLPGVHQGDARADLGGDHEAGVHRRYFHGARIEATHERRRAFGPTESCGATRRCSSTTRRAASSTSGARSTIPSSPSEEQSRVTWEIEPRTSGVMQADGRPRPARRRAEDGGERVRAGLDVRAQRPEDVARDRTAVAVLTDELEGRCTTAGPRVPSARRVTRLRESQSLVSGDTHCYAPLAETDGPAHRAVARRSEWGQRE